MEVPEVENAILMDQGGVVVCLCVCLVVWVCACVWQHSTTLITHAERLHWPAWWGRQQFMAIRLTGQRGSWEVKDCLSQKVSNHPSELIAYTSEKPLSCIYFKFSSRCLRPYEPSCPYHRLPTPTVSCILQTLTDNLPILKHGASFREITLFALQEEKIDTPLKCWCWI